MTEIFGLIKLAELLLQLARWTFHILMDKRGRENLKRKGQREFETDWVQD